MEKENLLRFLYLAKIINERTDENTSLSGPEIIKILREEYGVNTHRQTFATYIEILQSFGMDIKTIRSNPNRYHLVSRTFDISELKLLIDAVASSKFISARKSKELIEKIGTLASQNQADALKRNIEVEERIRTDNEKSYLIIDAVNEAINDKRKISFKYMRYEGQVKKHVSNKGEAYIFSPYRLVWNGDYYYMIGWSEKHGDVATFRIDRVKDRPEVLEEKAHLMPKSFNLNKFMNTTFRMFNSEVVSVLLECDNDTLDSVTDRFGDKIPMDFKDGKYIAQVEVAASHVFYSWVFGFGGKVKILGPENVKDGYRELVKKAYELSRY